MGLDNYKVDGSDVTQPISAVSLPLPTGASTEAKQTQPGVDIGDVTVNNASGVGAVNIQDGGNSLTVDGTITANIGTTGGLALDATLTNASQKSQIVNDTGLSVDARDISTTPLNGDIGLITNSIIYGHTTAGGGAYVEVKVNPSGALTVDATGSSVSVTGSVTANAGTNLNTSALLLDTTFTGRINTLGQKTSANSTPVVLASDQTTIPVSVGLSTFLDKTFGYAVSINQPTAGVDNPLILIKNPNASGKIVYFSLITYGIAVANVLGIIRAYKNPTITSNGTSQTIVPFGSASTVLTLFTTPTISANGTLLGTGVVGQNSNSLINQVDYQVQLSANSNLLITGAPSSNNRVAEITVRWIEV